MQTNVLIWKEYKNIHDRFPSTGISFDTNIKDTSNHLLYSINNENWCGLGCTPDGSFTVRVGTWNEGKHIFKICSNGAFTFDDQDIITNSDFDDVNFGKAYIQLGSDTGTSCRIYYNGEIRAVNYLEGENYENNYRSFNLLK